MDLEQGSGRSLAASVGLFSWAKRLIPIRPAFGLDASSLPRVRAGLASFAVAAYIAGLLLPLPWDVPSVVLAATALFVSAGSLHRRSPFHTPLLLAVLALLSATALSALFSHHPGRGLKLSAPLLPGALLFLLVADHFDGARQIRRLYLVLSAASLFAATALVSAAWRADAGPTAIVASTNVPMLVVPNDVLFLSLVSPLSVVLLIHAPRSLTGLLAATSLTASLFAVLAVQSRVAALTMLLCLVGVSLACLPCRVAVASSVILLIVAALADALLGFPVAAKFGRYAGGLDNGRLPLWAAAWGMFLDAPLLGHGPHTFVLSYGSHLPWVPVDRHVMRWPHNLYFETLAEQGVVGFGALAFVLTSALRASWKASFAGDVGTRRLGVGAAVALLGFCVAAGAELTFLRHWVIVVLFVLLGSVAQLERRIRSRPEAQ